MGRHMKSWLGQLNQTSREELDMGRDPAWRLAVRDPCRWKRRVNAPPLASAPSMMIYICVCVHISTHVYYINRNSVTCTHDYNNKCYNRIEIKHDALDMSRIPY